MEVEYYSTTDPEIKGLNLNGSTGRKREREKCCSYLCFDIQKEVFNNLSSKRVLQNFGEKNSLEMAK